MIENKIYCTSEELFDELYTHNIEADMITNDVELTKNSIFITTFNEIFSIGERATALKELVKNRDSTVIAYVCFESVLQKKELSEFASVPYKSVLSDSLSGAVKQILVELNLEEDEVPEDVTVDLDSIATTEVDETSLYDIGDVVEDEEEEEPDPMFSTHYDDDFDEPLNVDAVVITDDNNEEDLGEMVDIGVDYNDGIESDDYFEEPEEVTVDLNEPTGEEEEIVEVKTPIDNINIELEERFEIDEMSSFSDSVVSHKNIHSLNDRIRQLTGDTKFVDQLCVDSHDYAILSDKIEDLKNNVLATLNNTSFSYLQKMEICKENLDSILLTKNDRNAVILGNIITLNQAVINKVLDIYSVDIAEIRNEIANRKELDIYTAFASDVVEATEKRRDITQKIHESILELSDMLDNLFETNIRIREMVESGNHDDIGMLVDLVDKMKTDRAIIDLNKTQELVSMLFKVLQQGAIKFSQVENTLRSLLDDLIVIADIDDTVIAKQRSNINLLEHKNIERSIIVSNVFKDRVRVFAGSVDSGRTVTAIAMSQFMARKSNTILIDVTGVNSIARYGIEGVNFDDLMEGNVYRDITHVYSDRQVSYDELSALLKSCVSEYMNIHVLVDLERDADLINSMAEATMSLHLVMKESASSIKSMKEALTNLTLDNNTAYKLCVIGGSLSTIELFKMIDCENSRVYHYSIPIIKEVIRHYVNGTSPGDDKLIRDLVADSIRAEGRVISVR